MQARLLLLLASLAFVQLACSKTDKSPDELKRLTIDEVSARIAAHDPKTFIYDNNPKEVWARGHVPGAKWLDEEHVTVADLPADKAMTLIFYCHSEA